MRRRAIASAITVVLIVMAFGLLTLQIVQSTGSLPLNGVVDSVYSLAFSPDGKILASGNCGRPMLIGLDPPAVERGCSQGEIRLWDVASGRQIGQPIAAHEGSVTGLQFSADGKILASSSKPGIGVLLWDVRSAHQIGEPLVDLTSGINSIAFSSDGKMLASASNEIRNWDIASGQQINRFLAGHDKPVTAVAFSPDGKVLASGDMEIRLWNTATGQQIGSILGEDIGSITTLVFSPDGKMLASVGWDYTIRLWDISNGHSLDQLLVSGPTVYDMKFIMDGKALAFYSGHQVTIWDITNGRQTSHALSQPVPVEVVALSQDGKLLATGGCGERKRAPQALDPCVKGEIHLFDAVSGQAIVPL
jgi:WD40 repeat protein